jgi:hypothetical protein
LRSDGQRGEAEPAQRGDEGALCSGSSNLLTPTTKAARLPSGIFYALTSRTPGFELSTSSGEGSSPRTPLTGAVECRRPSTAPFEVSNTQAENPTRSSRGPEPGQQISIAKLAFPKLATGTGRSVRQTRIAQDRSPCEGQPLREARRSRSRPVACSTPTGCTPRSESRRAAAETFRVVARPSSQPRRPVRAR